MPTGVVRFDDEGRCTSTDTRRLLLEAIAQGGFSHIIFMSHGWNTDFGAAIGQYRNFLKHVEALSGSANAAFKPVFVGVNWPSVWFPLESGPDLAAAGGPDMGAADGADPVRSVVEAVASGDDAAELESLMRKSALTREEVERAVELAFPALAATEADEVPEAEPLSPQEVVRAAAHMQAAEAPLVVSSRPGTVGGGGAAPAEAQIAGGLDRLDPRQLLRLFSIYKMKDRAGKVGSRGVGELLTDLTALGPPVHLVGHSFGAKVMLSALTSGQGRTAPASALLLQPAISHLAFATTVKGRDGKGGYRRILDENRVAGPIFITYSRGDKPLHAIFHLALRRPADLGEIRIATEAGDPPSVYAALGGYGPRTSDAVLEDPIRKPRESYGDLLTKRLVGLDGSKPIDWPAPRNERRISSHGDVANPYTAWALLQQMGA